MLCDFVLVCNLHFARRTVDYLNIHTILSVSFHCDYCLMRYSKMDGKMRTCVICFAQDKRFFANFPRDVKRCITWVKFIGNEDLVYLPIEKLQETRHVCGDHFKKEDFNENGNRLNKNAVPTLNLKLTPLADELLAEFPYHIGSQKDTNPVTSTSKGALIAAEVSNDPVPSTSKGIMLSPEISNKEVVKNPNQTICLKRKLDYCETEMTPRKKKLIRELQKTKCTLTSLQKSAKILENIKSSALKDLITSTLKKEQQKSKGSQWSAKNKISALAIYKQSPKIYRSLANIIPLPSERTLENIFKKIPMETGIHKQAVEHLKNIATTQSPQSKLGCLLFDEVKLKPCLIYNESNDKVDGFVDYVTDGETIEGTRIETIADHALVFMFQGLLSKFKQPIAYCFVKGTVSSARLSSLIKLVIKSIKTTGFRVVATVCHQNPTNIGALNLLRSSSSGTLPGESNKFTCCGDTVYIMYDIPHLFKSIRNNFLKQGEIEICGKKGRWNDICKAEEKNANLLHLSKLTKTHVFPKYKAKMRVKYAAQVLSLTTSAVLKLMSEGETNEEHSKELMDTALIIEDLDRLFDYTNGPSGPDDIKKGRRQNVSMKTDHLQVWLDYKKKLSSTKFLNRNGDVARNVKCVQGYITSLNTLQDIWQEVNALGFQNLNLRQLNQDALENLFGIIRQHSPTNKFPTCASFVTALKTFVISGLIAHNRYSNCQADKLVLLTNFEDIVIDKNVDEILEAKAEIVTQNVVDENTDDVPVLSLPEEYIRIETELSEIEQQPLVYVCGYLASTFKTHECPDCQNILTIPSAENADSVYNYINLREWWKDEISMTHPSLSLVRTVEKCINTFENEIVQAKMLHKNNICMACVTLFNLRCDTSWYTCESHKNDVVQKIFVRLSRLLIRRQCYRNNKNLDNKKKK